MGDVHTSQAEPMEQRVDAVKNPFDGGPPAGRTVADGFVLGTSSAMRKAVALAEAVAPRDTTILLLGETGSGKGLLARHVHGRSARRHGPWLELNCAALQKELAESELFGHEKGAFTGALDRKVGLFQAAAGGTLFLDEIGEMELGVQAKLLHVIENRTFRRVGGLSEIPCNVRLIAATHRDLRERVAMGLFREDLFHRLDVFSIRVPPLRERPEDIVPLARQFLELYVGREAAVLDDAVCEVLTRYDWPGNVRELRNAVERATILSLPRTPLRPHNFPAQMEEAGRGGGGTPARVGTLEAAGCDQIEAAVRSCGGNIKAAARMLGIARSTVYRKARRYGLVL
jgi:two-component system, NtrC family, response regulator HydG